MAYLAADMVQGLCIFPIGRQQSVQAPSGAESVRCMGADRYLAWCELELYLLGLYYFVLLVIEKNFLMKYLKKGKVWPHIYTLFLVVLGWGLFTCNAPGAPLGGVSALYFLRNYAVLLVVCCVCSTQLPGQFWQWCKGKAPLRAALCGVCFVLCTAYVVAATGSTALYANF